MGSMQGVQTHTLRIDISQALPNKTHQMKLSNSPELKAVKAVAAFTLFFYLGVDSCPLLPTEEQAVLHAVAAPAFHTERSTTSLVPF